jgi:hypothetical protein
MSYNMTPTCITCGRNRRQIDECGYTINDEWTCYGCIIKALEAQLATALKELAKPRCEHCGSDQMRLKGCMRCGAPQCCNVCCQITTLEAQLASTKLKWQTGKPPKIGYYWVDSQHPRPKSVSPGWWDIMDMTGFSWAGPIPEPEEK